VADAFSERAPDGRVLVQLLAGPRQNLHQPLALRLSRDGADPDEEVVDGHRLGAKEDEFPTALELLAVLLEEAALVLKRRLDHVVVEQGQVLRRPDLLVVEQERAIFEQAAFAPAIDDLLDRLSLTDVEQSHRGSILAVFEAERGNQSSVLSLCSHTFAFSDVLKGDRLEIGSGVNDVKAPSSPPCPRGARLTRSKLGHAPCRCPTSQVRREHPSRVGLPRRSSPEAPS
jgi:hypothetical protein